MSIESVQIMDSRQNIVASAEVEYNGEYYSGFVNLGRMPPLLRSQFEEFESLVNDMVLSLIDEIEEQIRITLFTVVFDDGSKFTLKDLQIYPNEGFVSFQLEQGETRQHQSEATLQLHDIA
jgi:hypothetical protein